MLGLVLPLLSLGAVYAFLAWNQRIPFRLFGPPSTPGGNRATG